jgi:hypothetical protein
MMSLPVGNPLGKNDLSVTPAIILAMKEEVGGTMIDWLGMSSRGLSGTLPMQNLC